MSADIQIPVISTYLNLPTNEFAELVYAIHSFGKLNTEVSKPLKLFVHNLCEVKICKHFILLILTTNEPPLETHKTQCAFQLQRIYVDVDVSLYMLQNALAFVCLMFI